MEFLVKFNIKFRLKFLAKFSQGFIVEAFAKFKALLSAQLGICAEFKFGERAAELKADFLSRFLTRGAEWSATRLCTVKPTEARLRAAKSTEAG